jgi:hypothetical protein
MADELKYNENILIKTDEQNVLYLDPNSLIDDGVVKQRLVQHEKLVMYVNLEAEIIPRSRVNLAGDSNLSKTSIVSLWKGNINFMKPDGADVFDTSWSDIQSAALDKGSVMYHSATSQTFGIESVMVKLTAAGIPQVTIKFIDVRGKTLFESPDNSPYKAFFHLPYPIFYLTMKGFYGKAVRYQLALKNFNARFDSSSGNYEVVCDFLGAITPLLSDIKVQYIMSVPHMYPQQNTIADKSRTVADTTVKSSTQVYNTSKGMEILKQVFDEYKTNGIIPKDFPYMTLHELVVKSEKITSLLENNFFADVIDAKVLSDMDAFESDLDYFSQHIEATRSYLDTTPTGELQSKKTYFRLAKQFENKLAEVLAAIDKIITTYVPRLNENNAFGEQRTPPKANKKIIPQTVAVNIKNNYTEKVNNVTYISIDNILSQINTIKNAYIKNRIPVEAALNEQINIQVKSKSGLGFEPTTRNIFAIVLAGADAFLRLMSEVHEKAIGVAKERADVITDVNEKLFPFPQIVMKNGTDKPNVLVYPGDISVRSQLRSYDGRLWPEVSFVEEYYRASAELQDALVHKEAHLNDVTDVFPQDDGKNLNYAETSTWTYDKVSPYLSKTAINVFYEFYERAYIASVYSGLENFAAIKQLAHIEAKNVKDNVAGVAEVEQKLKANRNLSTLKTELFELSPFKRWENTKDEIFTTKYLLPTQLQDYDLLPVTEETQVDSALYANYSEVHNEISGENGLLVKNLYPINNKLFYRQLQGKEAQSTLNNTDFSVNKVLKVDITHGLLSSNSDIDNWYFGEKNNIFKDANFYHSGITINILNTPFFTNALQKDIPEKNYRRSAYLFLNSLPIVNLYNLFAGSDKYVFAGFNQYAAVHKLPYLFVLKMGSVWNRYKQKTDYLDVFHNNDVEELFDGSAGLTLNLSIDGATKSVAGLDNNVGFYPKYFDMFYGGLNNGQLFFGMTGATTQEYESVIQNRLNHNKLTLYTPKTNSPQIDYFTAYARLTGDTYFLFPSSAGLHLDKFNSIKNYQNLTTRIYLDEVNVAELSFDGFTAPKQNEYFRSSSRDDFSFDANYYKALDLLATFKPQILDLFEEVFLEFCGTKGDLTMQSILKSLCTLTTTFSDPLIGFKTVQEQVCEDLSKKLIEQYYHLKIANPKEINLKTLNNFIEHSEAFHLPHFNPTQVDSTTNEDLKNIIGEDFDGHYLKFFQTYNLSFDKDNFTKFRMLVRYYGGLKERGISDASFVTSVRTLANSYQNKLNEFVTTAFEDLNKINLTQVRDLPLSLQGFNDNQTIKLELYNTFKTFNDRWVGGNIIADKTLMNDFLFLDRANRDIGQKTFVNLFRLQNILNDNNGNMRLDGLIGELLKDTGFNFIPLPAYVNFYGITEVGDTGRPRYSSSQIATDLFGTFLEVDYLNTSPKFLCQYVGLSSSHLNMNGVSKDYKFSNDSFDMSNIVENPVAGKLETSKTARFDKSNRVVCFEVNFGDQAQGIFKDISLDQANFKDTAESFRILEELANSNLAHVGTELFSVYKNRSYTCEVTMLGNVMIQPTMYFQLRNVPMFAGAYLIYEVRHEIRNNQVVTTFTGSRISKFDLPELDEVMISTNKIIYQRLLNRAKSYQSK